MVEGLGIFSLVEGLGNFYPNNPTHVFCNTLYCNLTLLQHYKLELALPSKLCSDNKTLYKTLRKLALPSKLCSQKCIKLLQKLQSHITIGVCHSCGLFYHTLVPIDLEYLDHILQINAFDFTIPDKMIKNCGF